MKPGFVFLIVFAMALSGSVDLLAGHGQKPKTAQKETQRKAYPGCWPGEPEIENLNPARHRPNLLPPEHSNYLVKRTIMLLRLCVSETGEVSRVLMLESSGNPDIDNHFTTQVSKWTFPPAERDEKRVRSFVPVAITLHLK